MKRYAWALLLASTGCQGEPEAPADGLTPVTIETSGGERRLRVELADTADEQAKGLMFRTDLPENGGMLFAPYPPSGEPTRDTSFYMRDTPTSLDIIFIRADRTVARIAENTVPFAEEPIPSGEPVAAVLEIKGGRSAALGIAEGDRVTWPGPAR